MKNVSIRYCKFAFYELQFLRILWRMTFGHKCIFHNCHFLSFGICNLITIEKNCTLRKYYFTLTIRNFFWWEENSNEPKWHLWEHARTTSRKPRKEVASLSQSLSRRGEFGAVEKLALYQTIWRCGELCSELIDRQIVRRDDPHAGECFRRCACYILCEGITSVD